MTPEILAILCCPESHQGLSHANESVLARVNAAITAGTARNLSGQAVKTKLDAALIREDGKRLYPIREGLPILLVDEAIEIQG